MKHDQETYVRSRNASVIGLVLQLLLSIGVAILGLHTESGAIISVAWYLFGGLPVWVVLILLYNQHRLECIETLENERLAATDAAASAIFNAASDELDVARRRLAGLYKWGLNGVSIFVSLYLLGMGLWLFLSSQALFTHSYTPEQQANGKPATEFMFEFLGERGIAASLTRDYWGWVAISVIVTIISFVAARYQAGMTKVKEWGLLRGGASYLMGVTLMMGLVSVSGVGVLFGERFLTGVMALVIPGLMILLGAEMAMVHFLGAYRPRKQGEVPRPAFDSRLLGWLTSPESLGDAINKTINYQFGVEVSKSWFYQMMGKAVIPMVLFMGGVLVLGTSWVSVEQHQEALITNCGELSEYEEGNRVYPAGVHFKMPWPLGKVEKYDTGRVQKVLVRTSVGAEDEGMGGVILWNMSHGSGAENYFLTSTTQNEAGEENADGEVSYAMVGGNIEVQYKVVDLVKFANVANKDYRTQLMRSLCERQVTRYFMTKDVDTLLGEGQGDAGRDLRVAIQKEFESYGMGVEVLFVGLKDVHPPMDGEVAETYLKQNSSQYTVDAEKAKARQYATTKLSEVAGSVAHGELLNEKIMALEGLLREGNGLDGEARAAHEKRVREFENEIVLLITKKPGLANSLIYSGLKDRWVYSLAEKIKLERLFAEKAIFDAVPSYYVQTEQYRHLMNIFKNPRTKILGEFADKPVIRLDEKTIDSGIGIGGEID